MNLDAERHLSVFGKRAPVAKFRNKQFTAKGIRNDVTLYQSVKFKNEQSKWFISIVRLLNDMEKDWVDEQKQFHQLKILENIEKGKNLNTNPDKRVKIVRTGLSFYQTHIKLTLYNSQICSK